MIITMRDIRAAKMCSKGARDFFRRHGIDWSKFVREGVPEEALLSTGDAMAKRVVEVAHERRG